MKVFLWRLRFSLAFYYIFSNPKGAFTGNHFMLGWKISSMQKMDQAPKQAALDEVTSWYYD